MFCNVFLVRICWSLNRLSQDADVPNAQRVALEESPPPRHVSEPRRCWTCLPKTPTLPHSYLFSHVPDLNLDLGQFIQESLVDFIH
jgi:hypothetical protein